MNYFVLGILFGRAATLIFRAYKPKRIMRIGKLYSITARGYDYVVRVLGESAQFNKDGYQLEVLDEKFKRTDEIWLPTDCISKILKLYNGTTHTIFLFFRRIRKVN